MRGTNSTFERSGSFSDWLKTEKACDDFLTEYETSTVPESPVKDDGWDLLACEESLQDDFIDENGAVPKGHSGIHPDGLKMLPTPPITMRAQTRMFEDGSTTPLPRSRLADITLISQVSQSSTIHEYSHTLVQSHDVGQTGGFAGQAVERRCESTQSTRHSEPPSSLACSSGRIDAFRLATGRGVRLSVRQQDLLCMEGEENVAPRDEQSLSEHALKCLRNDETLDSDATGFLRVQERAGAITPLKSPKCSPKRSHADSQLPASCNARRVLAFMDPESACPRRTSSWSAVRTSSSQITELQENVANIKDVPCIAPTDELLKDLLTSPSPTKKRRCSHSQTPSPSKRESGLAALLMAMTSPSFRN